MIYSRQLLVLSILALAGCGDSSPGSQPLPSPTEGTASTAGSSDHWQMQASATAGAALVLIGEGGTERLRIACRRNPTDLFVSAPRLHGVPREERLTLGLGSNYFTLAVQQDLQPEAAVEASGSLTRQAVEALGDAGDIGVAYGQQSVGPFPVASLELRHRFAGACRNALLATTPAP